MPSKPHSSLRKPKRTRGQQEPKRLTSRTFHAPATRAFLCGAYHHGNLSYQDIENLYGLKRSTVANIYTRAKKRVEEQGLQWCDPKVYADDSAPWANQPVLTPEQKETLVLQFVKERESQDQSCRQAIESGICERAGVPNVSISTLQSSLYSLGYSKIKAN